MGMPIFCGHALAGILIMAGKLRWIIKLIVLKTLRKQGHIAESFSRKGGNRSENCKR